MSTQVWEQAKQEARTQQHPLARTYLFVTLRAYGNPDYQQYSDTAPKAVVAVKCFEEAVQVCRRYISENELGGGNWGKQSGVIFDSAKRFIARISYNGCLWDINGNEIVLRPKAALERSRP